MNESEIIKAIQTAIENSNASFGIGDALLIAGAIVVSMLLTFSVIGYVVHRYMNTTKTGEDGKSKITKDILKANRAHSILLKEDEFGTPLVLAPAKYMKEMKNLFKELKDSIVALTDKTEHLVNHQSEELRAFRNIMAKHDKEIEGLSNDA